MYPSTRPLLDTRLSRLLQNYKSFLKKISPKRRQIRTFGGTHKFAGDFLDKVPENRARPLVSQQAQRNLRGLSPFAKGSNGLWHPADLSCLGRHAYLAGHCPNNSSLFRPLAAVVVVALWARLPPAGGRCRVSDRGRLAGERMRDGEGYNPRQKPTALPSICSSSSCVPV